MNQFSNPEISFTDPAIYRIVVQGQVDPKTANELWGLQVTTIKTKSQKTLSVLVGQISDQSALSGILQQINDMHLTVVSVNMLSEVGDNV
jgi:hypothetical protein